MEIITFKATDYEKREIRQTLLSWQIKLEVEIRVYVVDTHSLNSTPHWEVSDEMFMTLSENQGTVYTLDGFMKDFNIGRFDEPHYVIRFISVPLS